MALTYRLVTDNSRAGPLVAELDWSTIAAIVQYWTSDRYDLISSAVVNRAVLDAEAGLPEGARVELVVGNMHPTDGRTPEELASTINAWYVSGKFRRNGEMLECWPEHPNRIAWGDSARGYLILRWVKGLAWVWWVVVALLAALGIVGLYAYYLKLRQANWAMYQATGEGELPIVGECPKLFGLCVWWWVAGAAVLVVGPWVMRQVADWIRARRELERAEMGLPPLE